MSVSPSLVIVGYPEDAPCPMCEKRRGTEPGICHLLPSDSNPVSVFVCFLACARCNERTRAATGKAHEDLSRSTVRFFDRWLELSFGQRRGAA